MNEDFSFVTPPTASQQRERAERIKLTPASFAVVVNTYYTFLNRSRLEARQTVANIKGQIKTASSKAERSELKAELRELQSYCRMTKRASNFMKRMIKRKARALSLPFLNLEQLKTSAEMLEVFSDSLTDSEKALVTGKFDAARAFYQDNIQRQPHVKDNIFDNLDAKKIQAAVQDAFKDQDTKTVKDVTSKVVDHYQKTISDNQLDDLLNDGKLRGTNGPTATPEQNANPLPTLGGSVVNDLPEPEEEKIASQPTEQPKRPDVIPMGGPVLDSPDQDKKETGEERRKHPEESKKIEGALNNGSVLHSESSIFDQPAQSKDEDVDLLDELISQLQQKKSEYENNSAKLTAAKEKLVESERDVQNAQKTLHAVTGLVKYELAKLNQQNLDVLDEVSQTQQQITNNQRRIERINDTRQSIQNLVGESAAMSNGRTR